MAMSLGTRGDGGKSLIRDQAKFKENMNDVSFEGRRQRKPDRTSGGKKTFVYKSKDK